jgi:hypothetical protein
MCHLSQPSGCVFGNPNNIWWAVQIIKLLIMQSSPLPCYKSISSSINQSFIHSVSISVNEDQSYIWIICPFLRWAWVPVLCTVGRRGVQKFVAWGSLVLLPEQMLIKTNISGISHYSQSSTRWCFPGCDIMWFGRWLGTVPVCRCLCPRSL